MIGLGFKKVFRPRLVFAYVDSAYAAQCSRLFRRQGWEVHLATLATEVHRLVRAVDPQVVVVDLELPDESGWLTCAKDLLDHSERRFILVGREVTETMFAWAEFLGVSALISREDGPEALAQEVAGHFAEAV